MLGVEPRALYILTSSYILNHCILLFYVYEYFAYLYVSAPLCAMPEEARKRHRMPWNWNYRQLLVTMWVLGTRPRSFARATRPLN